MYVCMYVCTLCSWLPPLYRTLGLAANPKYPSPGPACTCSRTYVRMYSQVRTWGTYIEYMGTCKHDKSGRTAVLILLFYFLSPTPSSFFPPCDFDLFYEFLRGFTCFFILFLFLFYSSIPLFLPTPALSISLLPSPF
ncbi:hypothetical protein F5X96DRAFT_472914 [Biscogniauxia mediterranea]|nr:hypothetical protein F5X96DRAFT_472914 [Biscogniauxia mediterranea]